MKRLIADTGPILHLHESGALYLLPLIGEILLPPLVVAELRTLNPALPPSWATIQALSPLAQQRASAWQNAGLLHGGESEALVLAIDSKANWLLTDDAAARLMAESLNVEVHGSIGVLLWAVAHKLASRSDGKSLLAALEKSSLWMSPKIRVAARAALDQIFG